MGKDKAASTGTRAHHEQSRTQQDCCGTTCSLGEVQGTAEEGSVTLVDPSKKKESRSFSRSLVIFADLVILRVHGSPPTDLVPDEPQLRRDLIDISDLACVTRIAGGKAALCPEDRGKGFIEVDAEELRFSLSEWPKIVKKI